jgi:hypothetical protein
MVLVAFESSQKLANNREKSRNSPGRRIRYNNNTL